MKLFNTPLRPGNLLLLLALAACVIYAGTWVRVRVDLTGEKRFTISQPTRKLLSSLDDEMHITVLLKGDKLPGGFKKLANSTEQFLSSIQQYSHHHLKYRFISSDEFMADSVQYPIDAASKSQWLKSSAVKQNEVTGSATLAVFNYPIALLEYKGNYAAVNLLQGQGSKGFLNPGASEIQGEIINNAEAQMEYHFASAMQSLVQTHVPIVAYAVGNGEPTGPNAYDLSQTLQSKYRFFLLNLKEQAFISDSIKTLLIVKPTMAFAEAEKLKIDQYLMRGGRVLFLIDQLNAGMDSLMASGKEFTAFSRNLNLEDLLFRYGARINNDLVEDKQCDVLPQAVGMMGNQPQIEILPWPYFPLLYSNSNHPISKNLDAVVMQFPNSVDTVKAEGIRKNILLSTSNTSSLTGAPTIVTVEVLKKIQNASAYTQQHIPLAVLLEGKFKSLYANRLSPAQADTLNAYGRSFIPQAQADGKLLVTGDGDWVLNGMSKEGPLSMGTNPYTQYQFANKDFLLNALEYMTDESGIMETRSRQFTLRLLDPKKLEAEKTAWQWFNIGLPLALLLVAGLVFFWRRKKKYSV